ncbi:MAG: outer membrane beta-barrel protein [Chlamydiota bacterium]
MNLRSLVLSLVLGSTFLIAEEAKDENSLRWKGFNLGMNIGGLINDSKMHITPIGGFLEPAFLPNNPYRTHSHTFKNIGLTTGAQLGYNYQISYFIIGLETDFNYSSLKYCHFKKLVEFDDGDQSISFTEKHKINWFGTVRPRIGVGFKSFDLYVTGGFAYGHIKGRSLITNNADFYAGSESKVKTGWTVGGGSDISLNDTWSLKLEYLFLDFKKISFTNPTDIAGYESYKFGTKVKTKMHCIRLGINKMF